MAQITKAKTTRIAHKRNQPPQQFVINDNDLALERKIREAVSDLMPSTQWSIIEFSDEDKELIVDFFADYFNQKGASLRPNTKRVYVDSLYYLSKYVMENRNDGVYKSFKEMTRDDFFLEQKPYGYLRSLRKSFEEDPKEDWVNSYRIKHSSYRAFWKFLTQPELKIEERQDAPQLKGQRRVKHKPVNKKRVTREQMWTPQEHVVFLKYCEDKRLACAHAMAVEIACRPGELLDLKLGDIKVQTVTSTGKKKCGFKIGGGPGGKMKKDRDASISDSIPFVNIWTHIHPASDWGEKDSKNAYLFPSTQNKARYRNEQLKESSLRIIYGRVIKKQFPKLLDRPEIPLEDKAALRTLIYERAHFPYIFRHEWSTIWAPRLPRMVFNQILGHSATSNVQDFYIHEMGNEGITELEIAKGIRTREDTISPAQIELQPKYCPVCHESNKANAKFCFKCNFTISFDGELENREKEAQAIKDAEDVKKQLTELRANVDKLMSDNILYAVNASLQGNSDRDVMNQLASNLENAIGEAEAKEAKGEKLPVVVGKGSGIVYFTREEVRELKSAINKRRQKQIE